jgi:uncharacterized protein (TIGR02145 family)
MQDEPSPAAISGKAFKTVLVLAVMVAGVTQTPLLGALSSAQANLVASVGTYLQSNPVSQSLDDSLLLHLTFDGADTDIGNTGAEFSDRSGNGNNGNWTNHSNTMTAGPVGQAVELDGIDDFVNMGSNESIDNIFYNGEKSSLSLWIHIDDEDGDIVTDSYIINKKLGGGWQLYMNASDDRLRFQVDTYSQPGIWSIGVPFNEWFHLTLNYDSSDPVSGPDLYINGVLQTKVKNNTLLGADVPESTASLVIGKDANSSSKYFKGKIDDVRIYDKLLNLEEVQSLYNISAPVEVSTTISSNDTLNNGLVGHWTFDGPDINWVDTTTEIKDRSGQANHGNILGFTPSSAAVGIVGQAIVFDGADDYVQIPAGNGSVYDPALNNFSITGWFKTQSVSTGTIVSSIAGDNYFIKTLPDGKIRFSYKTGPSNPADVIEIDTGESFNDNSWHFVTVVRTGVRTGELYINGLLVAEDTDNSGAGSSLDVENPLFIGQSGSSNDYFSGVIDDVRFYTQALSPDEVVRLYQQGGGVTVRTCGPGTYIFDADGNRYGTVKIGNQCWMASNLNVGTRISRATTQTDNATIEKWCYNDLDANCDTNNNPNNPDGGLYQWDEMMQYSTTEGAQGICPAGWHIPSDQDFKDLEIFLGMSPAIADTTGYRGTDQGAQLRSGGSSGWEGNLSGWVPFTGFGFRGSVGYVWLSSGSGPTAWNRIFTSGSDQIARSQISKTTALPVRCVED